MIIVSKKLKELLFKFETSTFYCYELALNVKEEVYSYFILMPIIDDESECCINFGKTKFKIVDLRGREEEKKIYEKDLIFDSRKSYRKILRESTLERKDCIPQKDIYITKNFGFFYDEHGNFIINEKVKQAIEEAELKAGILEIEKYIKFGYIFPSNESNLVNQERNVTPPKIPKKSDSSTQSKQPTKETRAIFPDHLRFTSQWEIDQFKWSYPDCTEIIGNVTITGKIENLNGLSQIGAINGSLFIRSVAATLKSLEGLSKLEVLGGELVISNADGLKNLKGLENLKEIQSNRLFLNTPYEMGISMEENKLLEDISALSNLKRTRFNLHLAYNPKLKSLKGLEGFQKVGRYLVIQDNSSLEDISALGNLTEVSENTIIVRNNSLNNLKGLENLEKTAAVEITNNGNLPNLLDLATLKAYFE